MKKEVKVQEKTPNTKQNNQLTIEYAGDFLLRLGKEKIEKEKKKDEKYRKIILETYHKNKSETKKDEIVIYKAEGLTFGRWTQSEECESVSRIANKEFGKYGYKVYSFGTECYIKPKETEK